MAFLSGAATLGVLWMLVFFEVAFVSLRLWANLRKGRGRLVASDYVIVTAIILEIPTNISITYSNYLEMKYEKEATKLGYPTQAVMSPHDLDVYLKLSIEHVIMFYIMVWLVKFAILTLYLDLTNRLKRSYKLGLVAVTAFALVTFIISMCSALLWCRPFHRYWSSPALPSFCPIVQRATVTVYFVCTMTADLAISIYTIALLRSLNLQRKALLGIAFVVLSALISVAAEIVRFTLVLSLLTTVQRTSVTSTLVRQSTLFAQMEYCFGVLASCLPSFRLFFRLPEGSTAPSESPNSNSWFTAALAKARDKQRARHAPHSEGSELSQFSELKNVPSNSDAVRLVRTEDREVEASDR